MPLNVNTNESPNDGNDCHDVSNSEVPVYHLIDSDDNDVSDESDGDNYELLAQDENDTSGHTYYEHNIVVNWIDEDVVTPEESQSNETLVADESKGLSEVCEQRLEVNDVNGISFPLDDDKISKIKGLMSDFELPTENIPLWARTVPEEQWKHLLINKIENKNIK